MLIGKVKSKCLIHVYERKWVGERIGILRGKGPYVVALQHFGTNDRVKVYDNALLDCTRRGGETAFFCTNFRWCIEVTLHMCKTFSRPILQCVFIRFFAYMKNWNALWVPVSPCFSMLLFFNRWTDLNQTWRDDSLATEDRVVSFYPKMLILQFFKNGV